jgi:hypothetical protein
MIYMARGFKHLSRHDHRRFDFKDAEGANVEISKLVFDSSFQYGAQRTEGYEATNASVYLIGRPKEAATLCHFADDLKLVFGFHELFRSTSNEDFTDLRCYLIVLSHFCCFSVYFRLPSIQFELVFLRVRLEVR